jgi:class 3 adenylate cyclase
MERRRPGVRPRPPATARLTGCHRAGDRKTVTVLFCDVTGSTALGERLDVESFRQVMRRYFDTARRVIEQHGGTVEKFIGDAVSVDPAGELDDLRALIEEARPTI